jgi:hypothetical protein
MISTGTKVNSLSGRGFDSPRLHQDITNMNIGVCCHG